MGIKTIPKVRKTTVFIRKNGRFGAADRGRTGTLFTANDFKSFVSAYSTTAASMNFSGKTEVSCEVRAGLRTEFDLQKALRCKDLRKGT